MSKELTWFSDTAAFDAAMQRVGSTVRSWSNDKIEKLHSDLTPLFETERIAEVEFVGEKMVVSVHPDYAEVLRKHGLYD